jgi:hypothetical protein
MVRVRVRVRVHLEYLMFYLLWLILDVEQVLNDNGWNMRYDNGA